MTDSKQVVLPVTGMTCANCVATIERNLKKLEGVQNTVVNLASERAVVDFDPAALSLDSIIGRIEKAGYGVATGEFEMEIKHLGDAGDSQRLENGLRKIEGVKSVSVNLASEKARVEYIPTLVSQAELRKSARQLGFELIEFTGETEDAEANARAAEIRHQAHLLLVGLIFTIPLFILTMLGDFGLLPGSMDQNVWLKWVSLALATPVQFYVGWPYYVGAYKALRNRSANMDVLIALGSSVAYLYSLPVIFGLMQGHLYL